MKHRKLLSLLLSAVMVLNVTGTAAGTIIADSVEAEQIIEEEAVVEQDEEIFDEIAEESEISDEMIEESIPEDIEDEITEILIEEEDTCPSEDDDIASVEFWQQVDVNGVQITVSADSGVFPEGAYMTAASVEDASVNALVDGTRDDGVNVVSSLTFDITVYDAAGNEIEPDTSVGNVYVSFTDARVSNSNLDVDVYHITAGGGSRA
ncbi:MAG: hypothetical protein IJ757_08920 [Clostridiales bacterium]|nr:hypothetical protein [Clostridiales bacterium]